MAYSKAKKRAKKRTPAAPKLHHFPHVLLLVETAGAYGRGIIEGIGRYARENGPWSIQYQYRALDSLPPKWLKQWRGDGIISRTVSSKQVKMLHATKLPLVELHGIPKLGSHYIRGDQIAACRMAVEHFLNCGLRHFAYFSYEENWVCKQHIEHYSKILKEYGFDCLTYHPPAGKRIPSDWLDSQRPGLIEWLRSLPRPIGIHTFGDLHSVCLLDACRELDIAVPEEIAILGRGNDPVICETVHPTLSSLDLNTRRIGYEAAALLDRIMAGKSPKDFIYIQPSHVAVRQSTDLVAIEDADVAQAVRIIREQGCKGLDVPKLVERVGLSRRALERRFHRHLGRSPQAEIIRVRIERAKMLLAQSDKTSASIARACGFASMTYFTTSFRRIVGMKPQAYRKLRVVIAHDSAKIIKD